MTPAEESLVSEATRPRCPSIASSRSSRKKRSNRKKKAKEWTYYIATLKSTIDCIYEMCRAEQSIIGCKEALMYIQNADHDFQSLIEAINLEQTFSKEDPQAVAWEIRKSASSPIHVDALSPMMMHNGNKQDNDGWQIVNHRRRRSSSSTTTESVPILEPELPDSDSLNTRPPSVYERLSSGVGYRRNVETAVTRTPTRGAISGKLTAPRCAMDLPQTRASLAKMSYVRQQRWEKDVKPTLTEKLARQKRERIQRTAAPTVSRINFSDPAAVRKRAWEYSEQLKLMKQSKKEVATKATSLHSINESAEGDGAEVSSPENGSTTRSAPPIALADLDAEWRELTEEERSLAIEEQSLNQEIEKTESELEGMDAELVRQVEEEAEGHPIVEKEPSPPTPTKTEEATKKRPKTFEEGIKSFLASHVIGHIHEPGKVAEKHEKMCSPTRRRCEKDDNDFSKRHEEKLRRADAAREKLQQERMQSLKDLAQKREEVRQKKAAVIEKMRVILQKRMERAQQNRERNISQIVQKAKYDDCKVMEVQFVSSLVEGSLRGDLEYRDLHLEERKQTLAEERAKKNEERAAKEHAAGERRRQAEENRVKKFKEKEEKKAKQMERAWKKMCSKINVNTSSKDLPSGEFSLEALIERSKWPTNDVFADPVVCVLCSDTMSSKLECFVHITGNEHLNKANISMANFTEELLAAEFRHLKALQRPSSPLVRSEAAKYYDRSLCVQDLILYSFKRGINQFRSAFTPPAASTTDVPAPISQLLEVVDSWATKAPGDEADNIIMETVKFLEGDKENKEKYAEMLIPVVDSIMKTIVEWDAEKSSLRFLIKMSSLIDRCVSSVCFALKCLFSSHLHPVFEKIKQYSKDNSSSPHFASLLDVCLYILAPFQRKGVAQPWGITQEVIDDRLTCVYDMLNGFAPRIPLMLKRGDSSAKWTRIHNLASFFIDRGLEENSLSMIYIDHLLHEAVEAFRISTGVDSVDKATKSDSDVTSKLANRVMHFCERVQQIRQPAVWAALFERPSRSFRYYLLLSELLRRSIHTLDKDMGSAQLVPHLLFLLRYFAAHSTSHQVLCMIGGEKSVVTSICALPDDFYQMQAVAVQTIPTLVLMTYENQYARQKLLSKRCCRQIVSFIKNAPTTEPFRVSLNHVLKDENGSWASAVTFYRS